MWIDWLEGNMVEKDEFAGLTASESSFWRFDTMSITCDALVSVRFESA